MSESNSKRFSPEQKSQAWAVSGYNIENKDVTSKHQTLRQFNSDINLNFQRGYGSSVVTAVNPVSFKRNSDPNKCFLLWSVPPSCAERCCKSADRQGSCVLACELLADCAQVVERNVESIKVEEKHLEKDIKITQVVPVIQEVKKEIVYEKEVLKEEVQEIVVDKYVERIVEVIKEVPVDRVVQRREAFQLCCWGAADVGCRWRWRGGEGEGEGEGAKIGGGKVERREVRDKRKEG
eukprot:746976-Hanusia_phi.AAC.3